jgi:hypothetical protein
MKELKRITVVIVLMGLIGGCTKTETKSSAAETAAVLLAGASGSSKSWQVSQLQEQQVGSSSVATINASDLNSCESDNVYTFINNSTQSYTLNEGLSVCTTGDATTIESGSWGLTDDGKTLLIEGVDNITQTQFTAENNGKDLLLGYLLLNNGTPLTITQLTANSITLTYLYTDSSNTTYNEYITLTPKK